MSISRDESVWVIGKLKLEDNKNTSFKDATRKHPTLKELQEKRSPFLDSDLSRMLDDILGKGIIKLPEQSSPKKVEEPLTQNIVAIRSLPRIGG